MTQPRPQAYRPAPLAGLLLLAALLGGRAAGGEAQLVPPDPASFRAYDQPSDEGNTIGVEWGRSPSEAPDVFYLLEIATPEDAEEGQFKTIRLPSQANLKSEKPEYFGFGEENRRVHYYGVVPANYYPPERKDIRPPRMLPEEEWDEPEKPEVDPADAVRVAYLHTIENKRLREERRRINGQVYCFRLAIVREGGEPVYVTEDGEPKVVAAQAEANLFKHYKLNVLVFSVLFCGVVLAFIGVARRNPNLFIRRIAGLEAVDEAIGRATEMGRPILFVHGLGALDELATLAALNILGRVCRRAAQFGTRVRVANWNPLVLAVSQETAEQAYTQAGRPDAYSPDDVTLVASNQFSYVAAVSGIMVRERPATIFIIGKFFAESLLLAETGASTGAIQIAGTDSYTQLPFFVTTCDYTLMGEELYAASAYLTRQPMMIGSLRGQDVGKAILMGLLVVGSVVASTGSLWVAHLLKAF
ncbi:MAG: DUF6754 domain-containing protein [Candidatus Brocadiia bacterium]